jgi:hypothetical protein
LTRDLPERNQIVTVAANGRFTINLPMRSNDVTLLTLDRVAARR